MVSPRRTQIADLFAELNDLRRKWGAVSRFMEDMPVVLPRRPAAGAGDVAADIAREHRELRALHDWASRFYRWHVAASTWKEPDEG